MTDLMVSRRALLKGLGLAVGAGMLPDLARAEKPAHRKHPSTAIGSGCV